MVIPHVTDLAACKFARVTIKFTWIVKGSYEKILLFTNRPAVVSMF